MKKKIKIPKEAVKKLTIDIITMYERYLSEENPKNFDLYWRPIEIEVEEIEI